MHTVRLLTVSPSMHRVGGIALGGRVPGLLLGDLLWGGGIPACTETDTPRGQNDRHVKKYNLRKLRLRAVKAIEYFALT